jgi:hypothetical protein
MRRASSSLLKTLVGSLASVVRSSNLAAEVDRRGVDVRGPRGGVDVQFADVDVAAGDLLDGAPRDRVDDGAQVR